MHPKTKHITVFERSTYLPTQKPPVHIYIYIPRPSLRPHRTAPHRTARPLPPDHDLSHSSQAPRAPRKRSGHAFSITVFVPPSASICILPFPADGRNPPASCGARTRKPSSGGRCVFLGGAAVCRMVRARGIFLTPRCGLESLGAGGERMWGWTFWGLCSRSASCMAFMKRAADTACGCVSGGLSRERHVANWRLRLDRT